MPDHQRRSRSTRTRKGLGRGLSALFASLFALTLAVATPVTAQAVPESGPTVSWSISFESPVRAKVNDVAIDSGDSVVPGSRVVFEVDLRNGYTYPRAPQTTGCDLEYKSSSGGTDFWEVEPVTGDCTVHFHARWMTISPYAESFAPEIVRGEPYRLQFEQNHGYGPFTNSTWAVADPYFLPPGLTINADTGELAGTPTTLGSYRFEMVITNEAGHFYDEDYTLHVVDVVSSLDGLILNDGELHATTFSSGYYSAWSAYDVDQVTVESITTDPRATVTVNGEPVSRGNSSPPIPLSVGATHITIEVTGDRSSSYTLSVHRAEADVSVAVPSLPDSNVGDSFGPVELSASGGAAPYTFDLVSGELPEGMDLSSAGELSGTPVESGDFDVTFRATDKDRNEGTRTATVTVTDYVMPSFTTQPVNADLAIGETAEFSAVVTGHPAPSVAWQTSTDEGATWQSISADPLAEVSIDGLSVSVTASTVNHGNLYRALASNTRGETSSDSAALSVQADVTFNTGDGSAVPSETVTLGEAVDEPAAPTRDGYTFIGWFNNSDLLPPVYDFDAVVTDNLTLYAGWEELPIVELEFEVDSETLNVDQGDTVTITTEGIAADGYSFGDVTADTTLTSSVETDVIEGNTVTFITASEHIITVTHAGGAQTEIVFAVTPNVADEVPVGGGENPSEPAAGLSATGADGGVWALLTALLLLGAGAGVLLASRRRI